MLKPKRFQFIGVDTIEIGKMCVANHTYIVEVLNRDYKPFIVYERGAKNEMLNFESYDKRSEAFEDLYGRTIKWFN